MKTYYFDDFPIPKDILPEKLARLLEPVSLLPNQEVEVSALYENDLYGPDREHLHMLMAVIPEGKENEVGVLEESSHGVVSYSVPWDDEKGCCAEYQESVSGYDYIVASRGDGHFYSYVLAEKVWMMLGLTLRCVGGNSQRIIFDDLSLPKFAVAEGEVSNEYHFKPNRNVSWKMSNEYLRKYLWMRNAYAARVFFYEALLSETPELRKIMNSNEHVVLEPDGGWYRLGIQEFEGKLLIQCWATVVAVSPDRCDERTIDGIEWPGVDGLVTKARANGDFKSRIILNDEFLVRYEQNGFYSSTPGQSYGKWYCNPKYKGQWSFTGCSRVGRNLIEVDLRDLYKAIPAREVLHAHRFALSPEEITHLDVNEEHIVAKTQRLLDQMLALGDNLSRLAAEADIQKKAGDISGFSRAKLEYEGWDAYPKLARLAQVAPLDMSQQTFLSRCKSLHEIWQRIPDGFLKQLLRKVGCPKEAVKELKSLKLLECLLNVLQFLNANQETLDSFPSNSEPETWNEQNDSMVFLFLNNELRVADAHDKPGEVVRILESLGVDTASLNDGYGHALDTVYDGVIDTFLILNNELVELLNRKDYNTIIILTGWKGGTFGFRVSKQDQGLFRELSKVRLELPNPDGGFCQIEIELSQSFRQKCPEFRNKKIGEWMSWRGDYPWPKGHPPKYKAEVTGNSLRIIDLP